MEKIKCIKCGSQLFSDDVNIDTGLAKCNVCNSVFYLQAPKQTEKIAVQEFYDSSYKNVAQPKKIKVDNNGQTLTIEKRMPRIAGFMLLFFGIMWNGIIWTVFVPTALGTDQFMLAFMLPFILVGIGVLYMGIGYLINKIIVSVNHTELKIRIKPLPWAGKKNISSGDIHQLYVKESYHRRSSSNGGSSSYYTYDLYMESSSGQKTKVLQNSNAEEALFLERTIEQFLGIQDRAVRGELQH